MSDKTRSTRFALFAALTATFLVSASACGDDDEGGTREGGWTTDYQGSGGTTSTYSGIPGSGVTAGTYSSVPGSGGTTETYSGISDSGGTTVTYYKKPPDEATAGTDNSGTGSGGTAGNDNSGAGSGGTAGNDNSGAGSGGTAGAGRSGGTTAKNVPEGNPCVIRVSVSIPSYGSESGEANGVCKKPSDPCPGGTTDDVDINGALPPAAVSEIDQYGVNVEDIITIPPAQANCANGLVCCIDTGECVTIGKDALAHSLLAGRVESVECVDEGTCTGQLSGEMDIGCPEGKTCCTKFGSLSF